MSDFRYELDPTYPRDFGVTPSQTVGPYLHIGLTWDDGADVVAEGTPGAITIRGVVYDGAGQVVPDAMVETWQADADGKFAHPDAGDPAASLVPQGFRAFGRSDTRSGEYVIRTIKPGRVDGDQAPHINVSVFARGMTNRCITRLYFPDEAAANAADPVFSQVAADRQATLVAIEDGADLRFDVRIQGEGETVFFEL